LRGWKVGRGNFLFTKWKPGQGEFSGGDTFFRSGGGVRENAENSLLGIWVELHRGEQWVKGVYYELLNLTKNKTEN